MTFLLLTKRAVSWPSISPSTLAIFALVLGQFTIALGVFCIKASVDEIGSLATTFNRFWIAALVFWVWSLANEPDTNTTGLETTSSHQTQLLRSQLASTAKNSKTSTSEINAVNHNNNTNNNNESAKTNHLTVIRFALCGLMFAACLVLWACSLQYTTVANSTLMHDLSPLFATIFGWLIFKHQFKPRFLLAVGLTLMGVITIGFEDFQLGMSHFIGDGIALASAILLALYCLLVGQLRQQFSAVIVLQWTCLIGAAVIFPLLFFTSNNLVFPISAIGWLAIVGVVCFSQIIGQGLTAFSLKQLPSEFVSLFLPLEAVFAALIAWIGWSQPFTLLNCVGFILVLAGIYLGLLSAKPATSAVTGSPSQVPVG